MEAEQNCGIRDSNRMSVEAFALGEIANAEYPRFTRIATKILKSQAEAEDAVQEGLRRALNSLDEFRGECEILSWLTRIVINECLMTQKKCRLRSRHFASFSTMLRDAQHQQSLTTASIEAAFIRSNTAQLLMTELRHVPTSFRDVLYLRYVREVPMSDVACLLGVEFWAAKSRLHRARAELRRRIAHPPHLSSKAQ
jgi:RNA polymerase sigma factor (sigma-70 family)